jgi:uncharacterized protein YjbI with pentapeptide repeats
MRNWNSPDDFVFLAGAISALREVKTLGPNIVDGTNPFDLRGMVFPTITQCERLKLPKEVVQSISGQQEFDDAKLREVDFSKARLDCSVWNHCHFERVKFDRTILNQVRFFGCRFVGCSFRNADLRDASFSVGRSGAGTIVEECVFDGANFRGASCSNPHFRSSSFAHCKLDGFVFDGASCERVTFEGKYDELTFRGTARDTERNRLSIDLSKANVTWLNADYGVDLRQVVLPADGSAMILSDRLRAVERVADRLLSGADESGLLTARVLRGLYSDRAISPLEKNQDTFWISKPMIGDFAETNDVDIVESIFALIGSTCRSEGCLVESPTAAS